MKSIHSLLFVPLLSLVMAGSAYAQTVVPSLMNYQAKVTPASGSIGSPVPVNRLVHFKFWKSPTSTDPADLLYSESQTVTVNNGDFSVLIGNGGAIGSEPHVFANAFNSADVHLGITVDFDNNSSMANDTEITPRQQIVSTAFAMRAKVAESVDAGAITQTMLGANAVSGDKLAVDAVNATSLANNSVSSSHIVDLSVDTLDLKDNAVTLLKMQDNSVGTAEIVDGNVTNAKLAANAVSLLKMQDNSVGTNEIVNGNVTNAKLGDNSVNSVKIANGTVLAEDLVAAVQQALCPPGTIMAYAGDNAPSGWALCNGAAYTRSTHAALFAVIGTRFGEPSSTSFRVPDFRGRFLRGVAGSAGLDPDKNGRTAMNAGGAVGNEVGSVQGHAFQSHSHSYFQPVSGERDSGGSFTIVGWDSTAQTGASGTSTETRPVNAYVNYIIKF
jgi:hypothetical protein